MTIKICIYGEKIEHNPYHHGCRHRFPFWNRNQVVGENGSEWRDYHGFFAL